MVGIEAFQSALWSCFHSASRRITSPVASAALIAAHGAEFTDYADLFALIDAMFGVPVFAAVEAKKPAALARRGGPG